MRRERPRPSVPAPQGGDNQKASINTLLLVIVAWILTRIFALAALLRSGGSILVDVQLYEEWATIINTGSAPIGDVTWQYPPMLMFPIWLTELLPWEYLPSFIALALLGDLAILVILLIVRGRTGGSLLGVWVWASAGVWIGPILLARLDVFTAIPAVLAIALIARPALSGALAAIGALMKVWPGLLLLALPRRHLPLGVGAFVATVALLVVVTLVGVDNAWSFLGNQQSRGLNGESMAAAPFILANGLGFDVPFEHRFGSTEVALSSADFLASVMLFLGLAILGVLLIIRLLGAMEDSAPADVAVVVVLSFVLVSRVFSPQYFIWLGALAGIALLDPRTRIRIPAALIIVASLLTQPLYPWYPAAMYVGEIWAVLLHTSRIALLVIALVYGLKVIVTWKSLIPALRNALSVRNRSSRNSDGSEPGKHIDSTQDGDQIKSDASSRAS